MEEKDIICKVIKTFYFHCNRTALDNFVNNPSLQTWFSFGYASIPWFIYIIPFISWTLFILYFYVHRKRLKGFPAFVLQRHFLLYRHFYRVAKHGFWNPLSYFSNMKLLWSTGWIVIKDDLEILQRFFNVKLPVTQQRCIQAGCDVMTANRICIQCRIDKGKQARLKRIYTLLMMRKKEGNVWQLIPNDVFKLFIRDYFV